MKPTRRAASIAIIAAFLLLFFVPFALTPLFLGAAEDPAPLPFEDGVTHDALRPLDDWYSVHFPFRDALLSAAARLDLALLRTSPVESVIAGRDGVYFLREDVNVATGATAPAPEDYDRMASLLACMNEDARLRGQSFRVMLVPQKARACSDALPARFVLQVDVIQELYRRLDALGVETVDVRALLEHAAQPTYLKNDLHWNGRGAKIGAEALLAAFGRPPVAAREVGREPWKGDLARMMGLPDDILDEDVVYETPAYAGEGTDEERARVETQSAGEGTLAVFRDSFAIRAMPFLAPSYAHVQYRWGTRLDGRGLVAADDVAVMLAAHTIGDRLLATPIMPALPYAPVEATDAPGEARILYAHADGEGLLIQGDGALCAFDGLNARPVIALESENERTTYLAYPLFVFEPASMEGDSQRIAVQSGWQAYIEGVVDMPQNASVRVGWRTAEGVRWMGAAVGLTEIR